jgi:hypothetical protein
MKFGRGTVQVHWARRIVPVCAESVAGFKFRHAHAWRCIAWMCMTGRARAPQPGQLFDRVD